MLYSKYIYLLIVLISIVQSDGDKSQRKEYEKNNFAPHKVKHQNLRSLEQPFRMAKLNIAWVRAQNILSDSVLKSFYAELKTQDKELFEWKHTGKRNGGATKEELLQAKVMNKLAMVMEKYGLLDEIDETKKEIPVRKLKGKEVQ
ncbi:uncharacterized protein LOC129942644 [Eupeodes corollae]|uniref:uncharacterized protein LOC129942644 n=1 Tax=Eupeodes corollae TaxID=290404 RepID=UPI002492E1C9|nr:uncharacterized protein LOC129942644 [Eupeodes corollae]